VYISDRLRAAGCYSPPTGSTGQRSIHTASVAGSTGILFNDDSDRSTTDSTGQQQSATAAAAVAAAAASVRKTCFTSSHHAPTTPWRPQGKNFAVIRRCIAADDDDDVRSFSRPGNL